MNSAASSKRPLTEDKGKSNLEIMGEDHGRCEELGMQYLRIPRGKGIDMLRKYSVELGRPSFTLEKSKEETYKHILAKWWTVKRESEEVIVMMKERQHNFLE